MTGKEKRYVLGIDCGTQSLRAALYDLEGNLASADAQPFPIEYPQVGWAEQNPTQWWQAARVTVPNVLRMAGVHPRDVAGVSIDGTSCTVVACDRSGELLRPAILWMDQRAHAEAEEVTATGAPVLKYVSGAVSPEWMIPKAMWLKRHQPQIYEQAELICEGTDWLMHQMTGEWTASLNCATCKWHYAVPEGGWPDELLAQLDMTELKEKWPQVVLPMGQRAGQLSFRAAEELGLAPDTPVAQGGIDAYAAMLGVGVVRPRRMALVMGSSTCHMALCCEGYFNTHVWGPYPDALLPGTWVLEGGQTATGSIVKWFADNFCRPQRGRDAYEWLDEQAAAVPPGAEGLVLLDYWQGNRTPLRDPLARGCIYGLSLRHSVGHLMRAIYEGTALGTRHILQDMAEGGFEPEGIYACGGGTRSDLWLQIHADACQVPIYTTGQPEAAALGAAICAAVGAELFADLVQAAEAMVQVRAEIRPDPAKAEVYDRMFARYLETYPRLRDLMHQVAAEQQ